ncbi:unnamed protein product [Oreochromis niloticus]|nr:unnamed protein product [Mustela putorius furo]
MNCTCNVPTKPQFTEPAKLHIMPGTPQPAQYSYGMPAQGYFSPTPRMVILAPAGGCGLCKHGQGHSSKQATPGPRGCFPRAVQDSGFADCSADEQTRGEEKIPTLQPDHFDGSGSWKDFLYQFETCAKANCWTEKTMAVQLRFSLRGATGAIIHKNPKSARWSYQRIVEEVEAAHGPCSEHAAAIGIELQQRIRKPGEALHTLRDDIYEKVSIVYANRSELEQDCIAVEIFTNALADAEMVQKLLEEQPRTLARAYEIAHRFETTKRAARAVTQLMQPGARVSAAQGARTAALWENVHMLSYEPPERAQRPYQRGRQSWSTFNKSSRKEAVCHNCSGIGHLQRNCPSPRSPAQKPVKAARGPAPDPGTVFHNGGQDVMCVQIVIQGREIRALPDSGARRNVLPLHHFNTIPAESRPQRHDALRGAKGFVEKHQVLVAHAVVQPRTPSSIPIRVFNPGAAAVTLKRGAVAGVLQPVQVLEGSGSHPPRVLAALELNGLLRSYGDVFSTGPNDLGRTSVVQHDILTTPGPPVKQPPRRMAGDKQIAADQQDTLNTLSTAKYFSTLDLMSGYWQVEITPRARKAAAFCTRKGLFEWNVMPFGLCNAPATFQRLMDRVLAGLQWETCLVYLDDIIVLGQDSTQMLERLEQVFIRLRGANLKLKPSKCCLFREQVAYLGHIISAGGISTGPQKVQQVTEWPTPRTVTEVRQFVGLASYYRHFVENFATIAKPLHELTKKRPCRTSCPCTVPEPTINSGQFEHKGVQCNLGDCHTSITPPGQLLVGVVGPDGSNGESWVAGPECAPVAAVDCCVGSSHDTHPNIHRVGESHHTSLFSGWTPEQLVASQKTDVDIGPVWEWKEKGAGRPVWANIAACSPATKAYWAQWKRLYLKDGVLQMHDGPVGGHFGAERTLARLKNRYYWYNMKDDVTLWCRTCTSCAERARPLKTPQAAMGTVRVGAPMERIAVYLMGPLNETERHNRFILVVQDYFSKWVEAYPVPNEQAPTVAEKVVAEWVCRYGAPQSLHSDQGTNFESAVFQGMCELFGIKKTHTTPFHPQSDGQYDKNICQVQYQVGAAVWHLIKGTKRVRHKVRKFLPSYEGPYFVVGLLDDLVYCIKKGPRAKAKVVHHDRLKPYHSRAPLDNSWVFQDSDQTAPIEVLPPALDESDSDIDIGPFDLWEAPSGADQPDTGASLRTGSPPPALGDGSGSPASPVQPYVDEAEGPGHHPSSSSTPCSRPQRVRRAPDMFGD